MTYQGYGCHAYIISWDDLVYLCKDDALDFKSVAIDQWGDMDTADGL